MAEKDKIEAANRFRIWALARVPGAEHMNVNSDAQVPCSCATMATSL